MKKLLPILFLSVIFFFPQFAFAGTLTEGCFPIVECDTGEDYYGGECQTGLNSISGATPSCVSVHGAAPGGKAWAFSCDAGCYLRNTGGGAVDPCPGGIVVNGDCLIKLNVLDDSDDTFGVGNGAYKIWDTNELSEVVHVPNAGCADDEIAVSDSSSETGWRCDKELWILHANGNDIFYTDGRVGVGTADPARLFEVAGNTYSLVRITDTRTSGNRGPHLEFADGNGDLAIIDYLHQYSGIRDNAFEIRPASGGRINFYDGGGVGSGNLNMTILNNGNVGIGTDAPDTKLHIGTDSAQIKVGDASSGPHGILFDDDTAGAGVQLLWRTSPNQLLIESVSDASDGTDEFFYDRDTDEFYFGGNVGIGTTDPTQPLEVRGAIRNVMNSSYDVWIQAGSSTGSGNARNLALLGRISDDKLFVNYNSEYAGGTILGDNVGIGINDPSATLDILAPAGTTLAVNVEGADYGLAAKGDVYGVFGGDSEDSISYGYLGNDHFGVDGYARIFRNSYAYGVRGRAYSYDGGRSEGGQFYSYTDNDSGDSYGVYAEADKHSSNSNDSIGVYSIGDTMGGYFEDDDGTSYVELARSTYGLRAYGDYAAVYAEDSNSSGSYAYLATAGYGAYGYGRSADSQDSYSFYGRAYGYEGGDAEGGHFYSYTDSDSGDSYGIYAEADKHSSNYNDAIGVYAKGDTMGGYFEDNDSSAVARIAEGNNGITAEGSNYGAYFKNSNTGDYLYVGLGSNYATYAYSANIAVYGRGSVGGAYFRDTTSSNHAYIGHNGYGVEAEGATAGGYFEDADSASYAYVGYGSSGIYASGPSYGGRFYDSDGTSYAYIGYSTTGVYARGDSYGGRFYDNDGSYAYIGYGDYSVYGSGYIYTNLPTSTSSSYPLCARSTSGGGDSSGTAVIGRCASSSIRFKDQIKDFNSGLEDVLAMRPVTFHYNYDETNNRELGFIAEEMEVIDPYYVAYEEDGVTPNSVNYEKLTAVLVNAIKDLKAENNDLQAVVCELKPEAEICN